VAFVVPITKVERARIETKARERQIANELKTLASESIDVSEQIRGELVEIAEAIEQYGMQDSNVQEQIEETLQMVAISQLSEVEVQKKEFNKQQLKLEENLLSKDESELPQDSDKKEKPTEELSEDSSQPKPKEEAAKKEPEKKQDAQNADTQSARDSDKKEEQKDNNTVGTGEGQGKGKTGEQKGAGEGNQTGEQDGKTGDAKNDSQGKAESGDKKSGDQQKKGEQRDKGAEGGDKAEGDSAKNGEGNGSDSQTGKTGGKGKTGSSLDKIEEKLNEIRSEQKGGDKKESGEQEKTDPKNSKEAKSDKKSDKPAEQQDTQPKKPNTSEGGKSQSDSGDKDGGKQPSTNKKEREQNVEGRDTTEMHAKTRPDGNQDVPRYAEGAGEGKDLLANTKETTQLDIPIDDETMASSGQGVEEKGIYQNKAGSRAKTKLGSAEFEKPKTEVGREVQRIPVEYREIIK